jgi:hypothetical protein
MSNAESRIHQVCDDAERAGLDRGVVQRARQSAKSGTVSDIQALQIAAERAGKHDIARACQRLY